MLCSAAGTPTKEIAAKWKGLRKSTKSAPPLWMGYGEPRCARLRGGVHVSSRKTRLLQPRRFVGRRARLAGSCQRAELRPLRLLFLAKSLRTALFAAPLDAAPVMSTRSLKDRVEFGRYGTARAVRRQVQPERRVIFALRLNCNAQSRFDDALTGTYGHYVVGLSNSVRVRSR